MPSEIEAEETLTKALQNAQSLTLIPVISLIKDNLGIDVSNKVGIDVSKTEYGKINIQTPAGKNINVSIAVVDSNYNIMESYNNSGLCNVKVDSFEDLKVVSEEFKEKTIEIISYMLNCCLIVFNNLKNDITELVEYQLTMDNNTKLFILNSEKKLEDIKYLSIKFQEL